MMPTVTVLTTVRNGSAHLREAIASIRAQTFSDWEYLIVDDASDDATPDIVEEAMREDLRIQLIRREERGYPYAAANDGLRRARGRYVVRLDADDVATPDRIERQLGFLAANPGLRACAGRSRSMSAPGRGSPTGARPHALRWELIVRRKLAHSTACVEVEAFREIGLYRELPVAQDFRLWCELARRGWLGVVPSLVVLKRRHPGQLTAELTEIQRSLAIDVLEEHVTAITGESWPREELTVAHELQRCTSVSLRRGSRLLRRWKKLWRADPKLGAEDRRYLNHVARMLTRRLVVLRRPVAAVVCRS